MVYFTGDDLSVATSTLANYYTRKTIISSEYDSLYSCCSKNYIPLTIFCYKEKYSKSEATTVARMFAKTMTRMHHYKNYGMVTENISDLFASKNFPHTYVILIEGTAGIGKTTLCREIALQWADNKVILKNKDLLLLLFMHDPKMKNITNVELLAKHFFQSEILAITVYEWLTETDGKYVTIIIDGYTEDCGHSFINEIISRKILTQCSLLITSRCIASLHLSKIVNQRALILGFTKSNQISFIDEALRDSRSKIDYFKKYLQSNSIINDICYIPLIMNMLLRFVKEETSNLPQIQASLIQKYIKAITTKRSIIHLTNVSQIYDQAIKDLSQFAFIATQENQLTFTVDEVLELCENKFQVYWHRLGILKKIYKLGLLNKIPFESESVCCEIFHFSSIRIQEYLTGYYISSLPNREALWLLYGTFWNMHYLNVWKLYVSIIGGTNFSFRCFLSGSQIFGSSGISIEMLISGKLDNYFYYLLRCLKETDGDVVYSLLGTEFDLKLQKLSHDHLRILLSRSTDKEWKNLNLLQCDVDTQGYVIICEIVCSSTEFRIVKVDISCTNFCREYFHKICAMLRNWQIEKLVFSSDTLYNTVTINTINNFTAILKKNFQNDVSSDGILSLTYLENQNKLIAVYSAPTCIRWFQWTGCKLNEDAIKHINSFVDKVGDNKFKVAFNYSVIDYVNHSNIENLSVLLCDIQHIQLCGSYLHSKGMYLLDINIASTIDCHYTSQQELIADYLGAVLCHNALSATPYLKLLPNAYANAFKASLQSAFSSISILDMSHNYFNSHIAAEIAMILSFTNKLETLHVGDTLLQESITKITKALQYTSTLKKIHINDNHIGEGTAGDIATLLSHNTKLQQLYLHNNNFKTAGIIKIAKALQNISTLTVFSIGKNNVSKEAAGDIATVLSHNTNLQQLYLHSNYFRTEGIIKIAKALQNTSTLTKFSISNNNVDYKAANDIATVLSNNTMLQELNLNNNNLQTEGIIKVAKALHNVSTLVTFGIGNNDVDKEAADDIALALSHNTKLQQLYLYKNNFQTVGMVKISKGLQHVSNLNVLNISDNNFDEEAAEDIATVFSHNTKLQELYIDNNDVKTVGMIKIMKAVRNISTLTVFSIRNNDVDEEAANDIGTVLFCNVKLEKIFLDNNSLKTVGMIRIAEALQSTSALTAFSIGNNSVDKEAANHIATVLSRNTKLKILHLRDNNFETMGISTITKALHNLSTLTWFSIGNNGVGEEAASDVSTVLSHNIKLQQLHLNDNIFKTVGMIKIARALHNVSTLMVLNISNNSIGEEAADDIATVLSHNTKLQKLYLHNNRLQGAGAIRITRAVENISTLVEYNISGNGIKREAVNTVRNILSWNTKLNLRI